MHTADRDSSIYTELGLSQLWPTMGRIDVLKDDGIEDDNKNLKLPSNGLDKSGNYVYLTAKGADLTQGRWLLGWRYTCIFSRLCMGVGYC